VIPVPQNREPVWTPYGEPAWLVSVTQPVGDFDGLVIAVAASEILKESSTPERLIPKKTLARNNGEMRVNPRPKNYS